MYCGTCHEFHIHKTYHLNLDETGCAIVSETVLSRLKEIHMAGFSVVNEVKKPPPITLNIPGKIENQFKVFEVGADGAKGPV